MTVQKRSFILPVLHDATVQRIAFVPGGISLRQVAQTRLAMHLVLPEPRLHIHFLTYRYFNNGVTTLSKSECPPRKTR